MGKEQERIRQEKEQGTRTKKVSEKERKSEGEDRNKKINSVKMMTAEQGVRVWTRGGRLEDRQRGEVKGETGIGEQASKLDGKCIEHSSAPVKLFQVTESLEKRMNDWSGGDRGEGYGGDEK